MYSIFKKQIDEAGNINFILVNSLELETDTVSELSVLRSLSEDEYHAELTSESFTSILEL
jgi:hypothetical protein